MNYLASIYGDKATWSLVFTQPLAVIAQQWDKPKLLAMEWRYPDIQSLAGDSKDLNLYLNYHAQQDPDIVYDVLQYFKLSHS